jgi:hypothetical protein
MARRLVLLLCLASLSLVGEITLSCGSSSGSGGGNKGPYNVAGNWQTSFSPAFGATTTSYGAITSSGLGAMFDTSGNIVQLPTITGANAFSGNLTAYAVNGTFFTGGTVILTNPAQGNVNSATSIAGSFAGSPSGTFSAASFSPLSGSVVPVSGTLNGKITGFATTVLLTLASDGSFTGGEFSGPGSTCNVQGTLTQEGTRNLFDVTYNTVSGNCLADTQTGIAFESKTDYFNVNGGADSVYLYVILLTSTLPQVRPYVIIIYQ